MVMGLGLALAVMSIGYFVVMLALRAGAPQRTRRNGPRHDYVFVVPCLNEERVLGNTLRSLLALPADRCRVVVVDDGSDDRTADIAASHGDRVTVLRRALPHARLGKGAALNHAVKHIRATTTRPAQLTVVAIVDADGRLEADVLDVIDAEFASAQVGAVQIGVRILNRSQLLGRFQDVEFASFSAIVQVARNRLGSVGLGGNGQFTRLAALDDLGRNPWTTCLTEDLDLGLRLAIADWQITFTAATWVSQQGLLDISRLVRQRTRWVQGHFQCWARIPAVVMSDLPNRTVLDLLYYLLTPLWMLCASVLFPLPLVLTVLAAVGSPGLPMSATSLVWWLVWYVLSFGMSIALVEHYRRMVGDISMARSLVLAHGLVIYNVVWYAAGWRAVWRILRGHVGWSKTPRLEESPELVRSAA
ncbi:MAG TPA: glycosyltransferase family 2 protein [Ornithinibacter sp.]|nr:glycosyltransferase family 2 protein [Ornithinibacter sp.]